MKKRAQTAVEFLILVGVILFFFTAFFVAVQGNMSDRIKERKNILVREVALTIQDEIKFASESSEGYYREFTLPSNIGGSSYEALIIENVIYIRTLDNKHAIALPIQNVTGPINLGDNFIKKEGGVVKLNL